MSFFSALAWRLAILVLPWQTRWFQSAELAGWPWEQGRLSFYVSWFLIGAAVFALFIRRRSALRTAGNFRGWRIAVPVLIAVSVIGGGWDGQAWRAISQWWLQVLLLLLFGVSLRRANVTRRQLAAWFVISLWPHAVLGFYQFVTQRTIGCSWLGMASQLPADLGVSVIEAGGQRILRAYGGFSHPNVFAGWLVIGLMMAFWLASISQTKKKMATWTLTSGVLSVALLLTFSRGAWIAVLVGIILLFSHLKKDRSCLRFGLAALIFSVIAAAAAVIPNRDIIQTRFDFTRRLEAKSLEVRAASLKEGAALFKDNIFFGTGPNAELLKMTERRVPQAAPLEPPHNAYLLALVDLGMAGLAVLLCLVISFARFVWRSEQREIALALIFPLLILAMFDHYLWSQWAGQTLTALTLIISVHQTRRPL